MTKPKTPGGVKRRLNPLVGIQFGKLPYDTKDMMVKQLCTIEEMKEGYRKHAFRGEWQMAMECMRAAAEAIEILSGEARSLTDEWVEMNDRHGFPCKYCEAIGFEEAGNDCLGIAGCPGDTISKEVFSDSNVPADDPRGATDDQ